MPWTVDNPPDCAKNWTESEKKACVEAANSVLEKTSDESKAIYACIAAAGKSKQDSIEVRSAIAVHHTSTVDEKWDGPTNETNLRNDENAGYYHKMYAYVDSNKNANTKSAYKFPHHMVSETGSIGAANMKGCSSGIGILNGSMGGANIPSSSREGVYRHLEAHMMDGDMTVPDLRSDTEQSTPLTALRDALEHMITNREGWSAGDYSFTWTVDVQRPDHVELVLEGLEPVNGRFICVRENRSDGSHEWVTFKSEPQREDSKKQQDLYLDRSHHRISAVVLEPEVEGADGLIMSEEEIQLAAFRYMKYLQQGKVTTTLEHIEPDTTVIVESYIAPVDFEFPDGGLVKRGSWVVTGIPPASVWERVEKGEFVGLSLRAWARVSD